jgi:PAS domain S-box-containing protein
MIALVHPPHRIAPNEVRCRTTRGWRWFEWEGSAGIDDSGRLTEIQAMGRDVSERREALEALRASEARYRGLVESQIDLIMRCDLDLRLTFVNDAYCQAVRVPREHLLGASLLPLVHEDDRERALQTLEEVKRPPYRVMLQTRGRGAGRWFEWESCGVLDDHGILVEIQSVGRDVTERQRALEALRASEVRYRGLVESQQELVVRFTPDGRITYANKAGEKKFGMPSEAVVGQVLPLVHEDDLPRLQSILEEMRHPPYRAGFEIREITPEGWRWFEWEALAIHEHGELLEFQAVGRDVTERRAAAEALQKSLGELTRSQEQLRLLAQRQVLIREHERKRLGLDLHDDVCQELVGIGIMLESIRRRMGPTSAENASEFDRIARYLNQLIDHLRLLARELQPLQLRDLGLEGSLRSLAKGLTSETCFVDALFPTPIPRLGEEAEVAVYRIAQEALTNAIRHSDASMIKLMLATIADNLCLEVSDDGCGFDPDDRSNALGLVSMEERALSLGGRLQIWSTIGRGTTVRLECPLGGRRGEARSAA